MIKDISNLVSEWIECKTIYHLLDTGDLIVNKEGYILDPFSKEEIWIKLTNKYWIRTYNIDSEEVWNVCHGFKHDHKHYCQYCGTEVKYFGITRGFAKFCSTSCQNANRFLDPDYLNKSSERMVKLNEKIWANEEFRERTRKRAIKQFKDPSIRAAMDYTHFINHAVSDTGVLYLSIRNDEDFNTYWKFGITSQKNPEIYLRTKGRLVYRILYKGPIELVARLEYLIKINLKTGEYLARNDIKRFNMIFRKCMLEIKNAVKL